MQYAALGDTVFFNFAANNGDGTGANPTALDTAYKVRKCGAAYDAAPMHSGEVYNLSHVGYPAGCAELGIVASAENGFEAGATYAVFCSITIGAANPTGYLGSFKLGNAAAQVAIITPSDPPFVTGYYVCYDESGELAAGVEINLRLIQAPADYGLSLDTSVRTETSGVDGIAEFVGLIPGGTYAAWMNRTTPKRFVIPVDADDPYPLPNIQGEG